MCDVGERTNTSLFCRWQEVGGYKVRGASDCNLPGITVCIVVRRAARDVPRGRVWCVPVGPFSARGGPVGPSLLLPVR